jgi:thiamine pyrophosphokinase
MHKKTAILANGQIDDLDSIALLILEHERIVAVDAGLAYCKKANLTPHLIVGDFDSCPHELLAAYSSVPKKSLNRDKDETDLEVAIEEEWKRGAEMITLFGAWGKRIDHSLTNALILGRYPGKLRIETETEAAFAIRGKVELTCPVGQTISLIPIYGPAIGIETNGFKWELKKRTLDQNFIGLSNVSLKPRVTVEIQKGLLLCCQVKELAGC